MKTKDEIGALSNAFNSMTKDLKTSRNELIKTITELKQAEEKINLAYAELNQIFNTAGDGMRVIDKDFNMIRFNETFLALSGITKDETRGKRCYEVFHGPLCHTPDCPLGRILGGEERVEFEVEKEGKNGTKIPCILTVTPFQGPGRETIGIVENLKDISKLKRREEEQKIMIKELEERNKELDDFTYIISHDLKEPLRSIDAFSNFVLVDYKDKLAPEGKNYLERIRANADRMQKLIEELLEISRIGRRENPIAEIDTQTLVDKACLRLEYAIKQKNAEIIMRDKLPSVFCDRLKLTEVFVNLISNALKFTKERQPPRIEIGSGSKGMFYEFYIKDNGLGGD